MVSTETAFVSPARAGLLRLHGAFDLWRASLLTTRAPAKINLTLHIVGRRDDGYHALESLVVFTGAGDVLSLEPGGDLSLAVAGPTALAAGEGADNLVLRAARHAAEGIENLRLGAFRLLKKLPVAAGIGGGSSDAAAALRLLARANDLAPDDVRLMEAARRTGSDVPVCLAPQARMMRGRGEDVGPALNIAALPAVLVNPGALVETRGVFARLGLKPGETKDGAPHPEIPAGADNETLWRLLARGRNDMEDAACLQAPVIVDALAVLSAAKGCRLARMSGSGATCFALFSSRRAAVRAASVIRGQHPNWWVKAGLLR
jgi:4-diphosphocytidyl-2-C-methyl-D-erythritol kinase